MFQFVEDLPTPTQDLRSLRSSGGKRFLPTNDAVSLAQDLTRLPPAVAMMLVEHPDPRVPLALAKNTLVRWETQEGQTSRAGGPVTVALMNRAQYEAEQGGYAWTPLLDAIAGRLKGYSSAHLKSVGTYGFNHVHNRVMTRNQKVLWDKQEGNSRGKDAFLNSPWGMAPDKFWEKWIGHHSVRPKLDEEAVGKLDEGQIERVLTEYQHVDFLSMITGGQTLQAWGRNVERSKRNVTLTAEQVERLWGKKSLRIVLLDQPNLDQTRAEGAVMDLLFSGWSTWYEAADRLFARGRPSSGFIVKLIERVVTVSWMALLVDVVRVIERYSAMDEAVLEALIKAEKDTRDRGRHPELVRALAKLDGLTAPMAQQLLDGSTDVSVRASIARQSIARQDRDLAWRLVGFKQQEVTSIVMESVGPEVYGAVFGRVVAKKPDIAAASLRARVDEVGSSVERRHVAPLLAKGSIEVRQGLMGTISKLGGGDSGR